MDATILAQEKALDYAAPGNTDDEAALPRLAQRREALAPWVNADTRVVLPGVVFRDEAEIRPGTNQFQLVYAGPAHSMSDLMMFVLPERILFAGDIVQNGRIPFTASAAVNTRNWLAGLAEVGSFKPRFIITGHGRPATGAREAIVFTDTYIRLVHRVMGDAVAQWTKVDAAYAATDWGHYKEMPAFGASNRGNAYRGFLEIEAETPAASDAGKTTHQSRRSGRFSRERNTGAACAASAQRVQHAVDRALQATPNRIEGLFRRHKNRRTVDARVTAPFSSKRKPSGIRFQTAERVAIGRDMGGSDLKAV